MIRGGGGSQAQDHGQAIYAKIRYSVSSTFATGCSTYKLTQVSSGVVINNLGGKIQINNKILDLQHISIDRFNCKFSSEVSSSNQYLKLITDDQITNQSSFTLALVVKLGDIKQSEINNLYLQINTGGNTDQFLALVISLRIFFQIRAIGAGSRIVVASSLNEKKNTTLDY